LSDWHYIGNYGQLGPLKEEQMKELIEVGVIESKTYVWREGLDDWVFARDVTELIPFFGGAPKSSSIPPPPPRTFSVEGSGPFSGPTPDPVSVAPVRPTNVPPRLPASFHASLPAPTHDIVSDKKRAVAGLLNFLPGFGRFYLGYSSIGLLQLVLTPFCGVGYVWSIIDGIAILGGACPEDGYGRRIVD
jgi:hypothetical protein